MPAAEQLEAPEHPGGGPAYPVDGECNTQCDCGLVNPWYVILSMKAMRSMIQIFDYIDIGKEVGDSY